MQLQNYDIKTKSANLIQNVSEDVVVSPSLGSNANNVASHGECSVDEHVTGLPKTKKKRAKNRKIKAAIKMKKLSASERIANCGYKTLGHHAEIHYNPEHGSAKVANVETCASVWACPVCRDKILNGRADELKKVGEGWRADGGQTVMITFTVPHYKHQSLKTVLGSSAAKTGLSGAFYRLRQQRAWRELKTDICYEADVRVYEVTHGKNGWHPHIHLILYYKNNVDKNLLENRLYNLWLSVCLASGLSAPNKDHGVRITKGTDKYLAKWGAPNELSSDSHKEAKNGNYTIAELENELLGNNAEKVTSVLREYYTTMTGRKMLTWGGKNLRKRYLSEPEITDDELAMDEHGDGERLFIIASKTWQQIYYAGIGELLDYIEADREEGIYRYCTKHAIDPGGVVKTIKEVDASDMIPNNTFDFNRYEHFNN